MNIKRFLLPGVALILVAMIGYSAYQLWDINQAYAQEAQMHSRLLPFRPTLLTDSAAPETNQSILDLQAVFPSVVGWLTIPNTRVDYPFAQGRDNNEYLHLDLDQNWSAAGTIFMDYRNNLDFSDFNTILFGHHMRNGSMFATLQNFNNRAFFEVNPTGTIFLENNTYEIRFMAFAVIEPNDAVIYNPMILTEADKIAFLEHVQNIARHSRDIDITADDSIITLSTCNYEFDNARMVLIGKLIEI